MVCLCFSDIERKKRIIRKGEPVGPAEQNSAGVAGAKGVKVCFIQEEVFESADFGLSEQSGSAVAGFQ